MSGLSLERYTPKAVIVRGDTRAIKEQMKNLGGKFVTYGGVGWMFPASKEQMLCATFTFDAILASSKTIEGGFQAEIDALKLLVESLSKRFDTIEQKLDTIEQTLDTIEQ